MSTPIVVTVIVLILVGVIFLFYSRKSTTDRVPVSLPMNGSVELAVKTVLASEKGNVADIANAIKRSATLKLQETEKRIAINKSKLDELNAKKIAELAIREEAMKKQQEADEKIRQMQRLHEEQEKILH